MHCGASGWARVTGLGVAVVVYAEEGPPRAVAVVERAGVVVVAAAFGAGARSARADIVVCARIEVVAGFAISRCRWRAGTRGGLAGAGVVTLVAVVADDRSADAVSRSGRCRRSCRPGRRCRIRHAAPVASRCPCWACRCQGRCTGRRCRRTGVPAHVSIPLEGRRGRAGRPSSHRDPGHAARAASRCPFRGSQVPGSLHWSPVQTTGVPAQFPFWQVSPVVQAWPSSQDPPCGRAGEQMPVPGLQVPGLLHWSPVQTTGVPTQFPFWQVSPVVQAWPSLQDPPCGTGGEQMPVPGLQVPGLLHWSPVQTTGVPTQFPFWQVSPVVQAWPSLQGRHAARAASMCPFRGCRCRGCCTGAGRPPGVPRSFHPGRCRRSCTGRCRRRRMCCSCDCRCPTTCRSGRRCRRRCRCSRGRTGRPRP